MKDILKKHTQQEFFTLLAKKSQRQILEIDDKELESLAESMYKMDLALAVPLARATKQDYFDWLKEVIKMFLK